MAASPTMPARRMMSAPSLVHTGSESRLAQYVQVLDLCNYAGAHAFINLVTVHRYVVYLCT